MEAKKKMLPGLILILAIAVGLYYGMSAIEPVLLQNPRLFGYVDWIMKWPHNLWYKVLWIFGDFSEAAALKSLFGGLLIFIGAIAAHLLCRIKPNLKIYPISQGTGVLPWILFSALIGLAISSFVYGSFLKQGLFWIPTFLPGCTLPAAMVLLYGGGWSTSISAGVLCGLIQFPFGYAAFIAAQKIGLPPLCLILLFAVFLAGIIIVEIFRILPWNRSLIKGEKKLYFSPYKEKAMVLPEPKFSWMLRRSITDLTELSFFGSEIVGIFLLAGSFFSWFLNPGHICSGLPFLFPAILCAQLMTGGTCAFLFFEKWRAFGFCPTFAAVVGASVCVMQFGTALPIVIMAVILNVLITGTVVNIAFGWCLRHIRRYPVLCGAAVPIGICIAVVALIMKLILSLVLFG